MLLSFIPSNNSKPMSQPIEEGKEYAPFYRNYMSRAQHLDLLEGLKDEGDRVREAFRKIPEEAIDKAYAPGKWTIRQLLQHITDTERIFAYRACAIARGETLTLPGYDQDVYSSAELEPTLDIQDMADEFDHLRKASVLLFRGFNQNSLLRIAEVSGAPMSVRAIGFIMIGHALHHLDVLNERYSPIWK